MHDPTHSLNIGLMLGRLMQASEMTVDRLDRIDGRLRDSDSRMGSIEDQIRELRKAPQQIGAAERLIKQGLQWAIPGAVLWSTGSVDQAIKVLAALGGK